MLRNKKSHMNMNPKQPKLGFFLFSLINLKIGLRVLFLVIFWVNQHKGYRNQFYFKRILRRNQRTLTLYLQNLYSSCEALDLLNWARAFHPQYGYALFGLALIPSWVSMKSRNFPFSTTNVHFCRFNLILCYQRQWNTFFRSKTGLSSMVVFTSISSM